MTYSRAQLTAAAGIDPWALHAQVAGGQPDLVEHLAARFFRAAGHAEEAARAEARSQTYTGHGYQVGGHQVTGDPDGYARTMLHADHAHLPAIARVLVGVGDALGETQRAVAGELAALAAELTQIQDARREVTAQPTGRPARGEHGRPEDAALALAVVCVRLRGATVARLIDSYDAMLAAASRSLSALGYVGGDGLDLGTPPPMPVSNAAPPAVAAWWAGLTPAEHAALLGTDYTRLGTLQGLPAAVLDEANRHALHDYEARLRAEITAASVGGAFIAAALAARLRRCHQIDLTLAATSHGSRYLLRFDPDAPMGTTGVAVAVGNPDRARNTAVFVPGTTHSAADLTDVTPTAQTLYDHMAGTAKSVVVWLDGPLPAHIAPDAAMDGYASRSGPRLCADLAGMRAAHLTASGNAGHTTAIGHSYGSTLLGRALVDGAHRYVDDAVFVGSPGVGVNHARDLHMDPDHVWSGQAGDDPILIVKNRFTPGMNGLNPEEGGFGAQHFDVTGSHHHSQYFRGRSLTNIARIADGAYGSVHTVAAPDYRGPRELFTDGLDGAVLDPAHTDAAVLGDLAHGRLGRLDDDYADGVLRQLHDLGHAGQDLLGSGQTHVIGLTQAQMDELAGFGRH